jgi:plastin-1
MNTTKIPRLTSPPSPRALLTSIFILDLLEALRPGVVDPALVINVHESGKYEDRQ